MINNDDIEAMADMAFLEYWNKVQETKVFAFPPNMNKIMEKIIMDNIELFSHMSTKHFLEKCFKQAYEENLRNG